MGAFFTSLVVLLILLKGNFFRRLRWKVMSFMILLTDNVDRD